ncbi:unnamed protein product [Moneuplotes crassus]|uniref:Uncharacterized protein n=1 Tax=Euplotes crassus TaxID=5936 RepID=A0AAD2D863_EUPCR|nr:unnamed protein product [Moneuplotes crassus]|mmetsp:Transcript_36501/g.36098  ORF Transcript_36501/g.36098 Transcript_36501/m.36098 type:complete len:97 (-) Transcript_36501:62-352(-)
MGRRRTKKVGICGKYGTRYGSSTRKILKQYETSQHARYVDPFTGKENVRRLVAGIWQGKTRGSRKIAGGCYQLATAAAITAKDNVERLKKLQNKAN